ncbi:hypothetical protein [Mesorhizobium sp. M0088]|uniref:DUF1281 family ferredoxin-like fold protein n=1 Tax=Mesorhizobium sp. M0088 TaxID=2956873 RepID=UPI00333A50C0
MPNHVTTRCTIIGPAEDIAAFHAAMIRTNEKGETFLDFEQIIPMPASAGDVVEDGLSPDILAIMARSSSIVDIWNRLRKHDTNGFLGEWKGYVGFEDGEIEERLERLYPGCLDRARKMALCIGETGHKSWYDWSIANWGTKWNSYDFELVSEDPFQFLFQTAWSFPEPVFVALAKRYPTLQFECLSFDEGWNFAATGFFNPTDGKPDWKICDATDALYEQVYGEKYVREPDEAESA